MTDYTYIEPAGVIIPDTEVIQGEVQQEYRDAFQDQTLVVSADTPQGVLITAETTARSNVVQNNAVLANQINPNVAGGIFLDAIGFLTGIQRTTGSPTIVTNVTISGVATTVIPQGVQARTSAGDLFTLTTGVTIGAGGTVLGNFQSNANGAIACADGALNEIVTAILGWESVTNNQEGTPASTTTLGSLTQSDQAFRAFRNNTLAFNGISLAAAITSALYNVQGVTSVSFQENTANTTQTINGISMVAHSVYACVEGGSNINVAAALLENKSSGAAWNGSTSVTLVEPSSGQAYTVLFDRPTPVNVYVKVTTTNGNEDSIIQAILDYAAGLIEIQNQNGTTQTLAGFVVNANVSPFDISGAIMAENPGIYLSNVQLSTDGITFNNNPIAIGINQIAFTQKSYITVVVT